MNVLCSNEDVYYQNVMLKELSQDYDVKFYSSSYARKIKSLDNIKTNWKIKEEGNCGNYEEFPLYDECPPLDKYILDMMAPYQPNIIKMMEREFDKRYYTAENRFIIYYNHLRYWNYFLEKKKIDVYFTDVTPHFTKGFLLVCLCKIKNILVLQYGLVPCMTKERVEIYDDYEKYNSDFVEKIKKYKEQAKETGKPVELNNEFQIEYDLFMGTRKQIKQALLPENTSRQRVDALKGWIKRAGIKQTVSLVIEQYYLGIKTKSLMRYYESLCVKPDYNKKYIYFPLHFQPELTTNPIGGWYTNQYLAIQMLSYYIPEDVIIYVKEHPFITQRKRHNRYREHYDIIKKLNNVYFVPLETDTIKLLDNCFAVGSITGSIGYEALYKKKPYLMFGYQIMRYSPVTFNIRNNLDCENAMKKIFTGEFHVDDNDIRAFLKAVGEMTTVVGDIVEGKENTAEYKAELYDAIERYETLIGKYTKYKKKIK